MDVPIAFGLRDVEPLQSFNVTIDASKIASSAIRQGELGPAIIVTRNAAVLLEMRAGLLNPADILALYEGNWSEAIVVIAPQPKPEAAKTRVEQKGDQQFLKIVRENAPELYELASQTLAAIRAAGVNGDLVEGNGGRWINRPINTFTLKAQPRAKNIHFTLYGNPGTYRQENFLLSDQNSYSRGWVRNTLDVKTLAELARQSHSRRQK